MVMCSGTFQKGYSAGCILECFEGAAEIVMFLYAIAVGGGHAPVGMTVANHGDVHCIVAAILCHDDGMVGNVVLNYVHNREIERGQRRYFCNDADVVLVLSTGAGGGLF
eukprot:scaffold8696_cov68-Skeletonema_marinoi.AAC.1